MYQITDGAFAEARRYCIHDHRVANSLNRLRIDNATFEQKQNLAAVIHLCGAGAGEIYARRGFRLVSGQRCGDHYVPAYVARVNAMKKVFKGLGERLRRPTLL